MRVHVEVCVSSVAEARAALSLGADSVELCTWPTCGGVTPSVALAQLLLPVCRDADALRVLVRPGPGGFHYTQEGIALMLSDARALHAVGVRHLVIGALGEDGLPHHAFILDCLRALPGTHITFHRAIDRSSDPLLALDRCIALGVHRVLSSGGAPTARAGAATLARLVQRAQGRVRIAAAGAIGPGDVVAVVERTGVEEVHFGAWKHGIDGGVPMNASHPEEDRPLVPDEAKIAGVLDALAQAGLR
jgi:copper homeostasis protein